MATKKKTSSPRRAQAARPSANRAEAVTRRLRETWAATMDARTDARRALAGLRARVQKEGGKASREIDTRLSALQGRLRHEGRNLGRALEEAVRGTLVALNIPSRREVSELTHKVDELTRKIDGYRRSAVRPARAR